MTVNSLTIFSYSTCKYEPIPGTADWIEVAALYNSDGGYDWAEFKAFYSPSARRYFWHGDSGCSCNGWGDGVSSAESFENGDRDALNRAWKAFAEENTYNITIDQRQSGTAALRSFKEPS